VGRRERRNADSLEVALDAPGIVHGQFEREDAIAAAVQEVGYGGGASATCAGDRRDDTDGTQALDGKFDASESRRQIIRRQLVRRTEERAQHIGRPRDVPDCDFD